MDDTLQKLLYFFGTVIYGIFMLWVFLHTTDEYTAKENVTNEDYLAALIKRMLRYPCLVPIGIMFVYVILNLKLSTIAQYIVS